MPPRASQARFAEDRVVRAFEPLHDEGTGRHVPIGVPTHGVVTLVLQQRGLLRTPLRRKLIFSAEMRNAAEIEYEDRMQRVLPLGGEQTIIDGGNERAEKNDGRNISDSCPL